MELSSGDRLGSFVVTSRIGQGGMGEVYRARDTRLERDVAIKVLPASLAQDPDRLARFEREARLLAALNHPHIAAIYGIEELRSPERGAGVFALVLELVEGDTLDERIRRGPIPVREALALARQIVDALEAAHEKGIIHRDLKPANIKITPASVVKVLDFGVAKAVTDEVTADLVNAPTRTDSGTRVGAIVGTPAYMSPEQARGTAVDKRADIWAFGCVLYEMVTGRRAHAGETASDMTAAIIAREPDWKILPAATPARVRDLLRRCLQKDAANRPRNIGEARAIIDEELARRPERRRTLAWATAGAALAALVTAGVVRWTASDVPVVTDASSWEQITNFPDSVTQPALSPDGRLLAFIRGTGTFQTEGQLYLKSLPDGEAVPLTSDDLAKMGPVFSPDGSRIAYTVNGGAERWNTWTVPTLRGSARRWLENASGLVWIGPRDVLFSEIRPGTAQHMGLVAARDDLTERRELYFPADLTGMAHRSAVSPDRRWVITVEMGLGATWLPCRLLPFDGSAAGSTVGPDGRCTEAAWSPDGRWMYFSADAGDGFHLWRQRFPDGRPQQLTGGPTAEEGLAVASDGRSIITSVGIRQRAVWIRDATGDRQISGEGYAYWPLFSADGRRVVYRRRSTEGSGQSPSELWVFDTTSGHSERVLPGRLVTGHDVSRDGRVVATVTDSTGDGAVWIARIDGREPPRQIPGVIGYSPRFGADGAIVFVKPPSQGDPMRLVRVSEDGTDETLASTEPVSYVLGSTSPDGEWISVTRSGEGASVVLVSTTRGQTVPILVDGNIGRVRWSPDGRHIAVSIQYAEMTAFGSGRTYVLPVVRGTAWPEMPAGGFRTETDLAAAPGVEILAYGDLSLGLNGSYVYSRETTSRNLYRIPLR